LDVWQVNPNIAIELVQEDPVVVCTQRVVASDSGGPLGHPRVYINLVGTSSARFITHSGSVPIQLTQCWFPGLAISSARM